MPDEGTANQTEKKPDPNPSIEGPLQTGGNQEPPPPPNNRSAANNEDDGTNFERDIRTGEYWLIGVGIATVLINIVIAWIYLGQLNQMRRVTEINIRTLGEGESALDTSQSQFDRTMSQIINQSAIQLKGAEASREAAKAAKDAVKVAQDQLQLDQRPWVGLAPFRSIPLASQSRSSNMLVHEVDEPTVMNTGRTPAKKVDVIYDDFTTDGDVGSLAVNDDSWMKRLIDASVSGQFEGVDTIVNATRKPSRWYEVLDDPRFFPPKTRKDSSITPPKKESLGVLPPNIPKLLPVGSWTTYQTPNIPKSTYIIFGKITYSDIWGTIRTTLFCAYNRDTGREDDLPPFSAR